MSISFLLTVVFKVSNNSSHQLFVLTSMVIYPYVFFFSFFLKTISVYNCCASLDITNGKENVRVSCVNSIERNAPPFVDYTTKRIPRKDVEINTEETFLVCCDCTDDCQDKAKCQCWQLTIQVWFQI